MIAQTFILKGTNMRTQEAIQKFKEQKYQPTNRLKLGKGSHRNLINYVFLAQRNDGMILKYIPAPMFGKTKPKYHVLKPDISGGYTYYNL